MKDYEFLLKKISEKIKDPKKRKYIKDNLESICSRFKRFLKIFLQNCRDNLQKYFYKGKNCDA